MADIILILILCLFVCSGYKKGFAKTLINASANVISVIFSVIFTNPVAKIICESPIGEFIRNSASSYVSDNVKYAELAKSAVETAADGVCMTVSSIISFILIAFVVKIVVRLIAGAVGLVSKLPLLKQANSVLGALVGLVSGALICYVVIGFFGALISSGTVELDAVVSIIENSIICAYVYNNNIVGDIIASIL